MSKANERKSTILEFLPATLFAIPVSVSVYWYRSNLGYPKDDSSYNLADAVKSYLVLKSHGVLLFLRDLYTTPRGSKPILVGSLEAPFLILSHGNIPVAVLLNGLFFLGLLTLYAYLFAREYLPRKNSLWVAAIFGCLPWITGSGYKALPYAPFAAFALAALYHAVKSRFFHDFKQSLFFGIWLALALGMRPVESVVLLFVPAVVWSVLAYRERVIRTRDLALAAVLLLSTVAAFFYAVKFQYLGDPAKTWQVGIPLLALILLVRPISRRAGFSAGYLVATLIPIFFSVFWYFPSVPKLYQWIYDASWSEHTVLSGNRVGVGPAGFVLKYLAIYGGFPLLFLLAVAALRGNFTWLRKARKWQLGIWLWLALGPVLVSSISYNGNLLYYLGSGSILILPFVIAAMKPSGKYEKFVWVPALLLIAILGAYDTAVARPTYQVHSPLTKLIPWSVELGYRPDPEPEAAEEILNGLKNFIPETPARVGIYLAYMPSDHRYSTEAQLNLASFNLKKPWNFEPVETELQDLTLERCKKDHERALQTFPYFLVGPTEGGKNTGIVPSSECSAWVLQAWKSGSLSKIGLKLLGTTEVRDADVRDLHYLVLGVLSVPR